MHTQLVFSFSPSSNSFIVVVLLFITISTSYSQDNEEYYYKICSQNYTCGPNIQNISYPFWGNGRPQYCGHPDFELKCQNGDYPTMNLDNREFRVLEINPSSHVMTLARMDLWNDHCTNELRNITLNASFLGYGAEVRNLSIFYGCSSTTIPTDLLPNQFACPADNTETEGIGFYIDGSFLRHELQNVSHLPTCNVGIQVPVLQVALVELTVEKSLSLQDALKQGFEVEYSNAGIGACSICERSGGICGSISSSLDFVCHCHDGSEPQRCQNNAKERINVRRKLVIGFGATGLTLLVMGVIYLIYRRRNKKRYTTSSWVSRNISSYPSSATDLEKSGFYGVRIFSYKELEKATDNFDSKKELGDGGFGRVYKGKLRDGRVVAVKRLFEHNYKRVEQFMNEVEILTRLRHQNLVSLYGCTSHHSRELLLVYEYIPNGTVADHLHGEGAKPGSLSWNTRMSIAIETASALTYLHASDVIHRDVKTNNILLDKNFCVKVADFGLSRLFPNDVSHVSTAPQGTPGYVDPEYHECYQLTVKSDVFSFGVVLIELISSLPAVDITRHRHEINLSNLATNKIQNHALHELVDPFLGFESDCKVRKMITDVAELAFQCLQADRDARPSMDEVLEALKDIQNDDCNMKNVVVVEIPEEEDIVLLKSDPPTLSPDSIMQKWNSSKTTSNASS